MAELADALDLGSSVFDVQVQVLLSAPKAASGLLWLYFGELAQLGERVVRNHEVRGSIPLFSTIIGTGFTCSDFFVQFYFASLFEGGGPPHSGGGRNEKIAIRTEIDLDQNT